MIKLTKVVYVRMDDDMYTQAEALASNAGIKVPGILRLAFSEYLKNHATKAQA